MRTCLVAAENTQDKLLLKITSLNFFNVQWLHFAGKVDRRKVTYVRFH